jgi:hypothetical protein
MKRYYVGDEGLVEDKNGPWISYEDHLAALAQRAEVAPMQAAYNHLMNLQPHIAQLPKEYQPFIDSHVDEAMKALQPYVNNGESK